MKDISLNLARAEDVEAKAAAMGVMIRHEEKLFDTSPCIPFWLPNEQKVTRMKWQTGAVAEAWPAVSLPDATESLVRDSSARRHSTL